MVGALAHCLILDPDNQARRRLRQAMSHVNNFENLDQAASLKEAKETLELLRACDVVFISCQFTQNEIQEFIKVAKTLPSGQDAAYVLVESSADNENAAKESALLLGADGVLFSPFSVDKLVEIATLASMVRKMRWEEREKLGMGTLIDQLMKKVDLVASFQSVGYDAEKAKKALQETVKILNGREPESLSCYYQVAIDKFEEAEIPKPLPERKCYKGTSSRVKTRLQNKMVDDLEEELATGDGASKDKLNS